MNIEPVAWIKKKEIGYMEVTKRCGAKDYATNLGLVPEDDDIPLYTHPAKTLTDEDLKKCSVPMLEHSMACLYQGFLSHYGYEHSKQLCEAFFYPTGKTSELHNELVCRKNLNYFDKSCEKCNTAILRKAQE